MPNTQYVSMYIQIIFLDKSYKGGMCFTVKEKNKNIESRVNIYLSYEKKKIFYKPNHNVEKQIGSRSIFWVY